jgi:uroporphyrinogen-III synthase
MPDPRTLLLTRPEAQSRDFAAALEAALPGRFRTVTAPLIEIVPLQGPLALEGVQALLFTSANGVEQFAARCTDRGLPALCVGDLTAAAAAAAGFTARSAGGDVEALARLAQETCRPGAGDLLHLRGRHAAGDLVARLRAAGLPARAAEIYQQRPRAMSPEAAAMLKGGGVDVVAVFSPRSARLFTEAAVGAGWSLGRTAAVSLSRAADAALSGRFERRIVASRPDRAGMIAALASL